MSDLISRQAAISLPVKPKEDRYFQTQNLDDAYDYGWYSLQECIEQLPPAHPMRWIPCDERLPFAEYGESDNVLATCGYRGVEDTSIRWIRTLYFNGGTWCYPTGETYDQKVYAWMPMPEPYKERRTDG